MWGGTALFAKTIDLPALHITWGRSLIAALTLLLYIALTRAVLLPATRRDLAGLVLMGVCLCIHWVTYFGAIQVSTVAVAIVALHTNPVLAILAEPFVRRERHRRSDLLVGLVVFAGVVVLVPEYRLESDVTKGVILGVISAVFVTARSLLSRAYLPRYPGSTIMFYQTGVTAVLLLPWVALSGRWPQGEHVGSFLLLAIVFTALPQTLFTNSLTHLKAKTVSIIATLLPIYGTVFAAIVLGEIPSWRTVAGGAIILAAVFYESLRTVRGGRAGASVSSTGLSASPPRAPRP